METYFYKMAEYKNVGFKESSRYGSGTITKKDNHSYFDAEIKYEYPDAADQAVNGVYPDSVAAVYDVSFNQNIIHNPEEYKVTIARLFLKGNGIPMAVINNATYYVSLAFDDGGGLDFYSQPIINPAISGPNGNQLLFSVNDFIKMINVAFNVAFNSMAAGSALPGTITKAPQMFWDPDAKQLSMYVQSNYNSAISGGNPIQVWIDQNLVHLFSCWAFVLPTLTIPPVLSYNVQTDLTLPNLRFSRINIDDTGDNRVNWRWNPNPTETTIDVYPLPAPATGIHDALRVSQIQGNFLSSLSELSGISLFSNSINARKESEADVSLDDITKVLTTNSNGVYTQQGLIFDLAVSEPGGINTENIVYNPTIYRWIDLIGNAPINRMQFSLSFVFKNGETAPVLVTRGSYISIKFLFQSINKKHDHNIIG